MWKNEDKGVVLISFSDVTCATQGYYYYYAYAPTTILLSKSGSGGKVLRIIVNGEMYRIK